MTDQINPQAEETNSFQRRLDLHVFPDQLKFLIVEDDYTLQPVWERIIHKVDSSAMIRWARSAEGAQKLIQDRINLNDRFDFVLADIYLSGPMNGIDLWNAQPDNQTLFLFTSSIAVKNFSALISNKDGRCPFLLRKPLNLVECIETIRAMLAYRELFTREKH